MKSVIQQLKLTCQSSNEVHIQLRNRKAVLQLGYELFSNVSVNLLRSLAKIQETFSLWYLVSQDQL
jgi:hypothetical protein